MSAPESTATVAESTNGQPISPSAVAVIADGEPTHQYWCLVAGPPAPILAGTRQSALQPWPKGTLSHVPLPATLCVSDDPSTEATVFPAPRKSAAAPARLLLAASRAGRPCRPRSQG